MTKQEWRQYIKEKLSEIPEDKFNSLSKTIIKKLFQDMLWLKSETVGITLAINREIETRDIIEEGWKLGMRMAVPKCDLHSYEMTFYLIQSFNQLEFAHRRFPEPIPAKTKKITPNEIDLLIVPGLVFDHSGFRIGYGGGYYDRYLAVYPNETLSLAFDLQVMERIPRDAFDIPVKQLITEKKTYRFQ